MMSDDDENERRQDPLNMSVVGVKGLLNPCGENNCFLNSAVQVLWHLDAFRQNFRRLSEHSCIGHSCIFCGLKVIFTQFEFSEESSLPPLVLRVALAEAFKEKHRFQLQNMDDAAECFEYLLVMLHHHVAYGHSEDRCIQPHCLTHQVFAMNIVEQLNCVCGALSKPTCYTQLVHYITAHSIISQDSSEAQRSFGHCLRIAFSNGELSRTCPSKCGRQAKMVQSLLNTPSVVSIGVIWHSETPGAVHVRKFIQRIGTRLHLNEMFPVGVSGSSAEDVDLELVGVVCYYLKHYSTFFFHAKRKLWISFDDACVSEIGVKWEEVTEKMRRGRYQPLLLLYQRRRPPLINTDTAPKETTVVQNFVSCLSLSEDSVNKGRSGTAWLACQNSAAAAEDRSVIASSSGLSHNCNNNCSSVSSQCVRPLAVRASSHPTVRAMIAARERAVNEVSSTPRARPQPPTLVSPRQHAPACQLPSPLVPQSGSSAAVSPHTDRPPVTARPLTAAPRNAICPNQLPVYFTPECRHPNAAQQSTGYAVPFCRPAGSQPGFNPMPGVFPHGGMFPSSSNGSQQMLRPVGMLQPRLPPSYPPPHPPPQAPSGVIPPPVCHVSTGRNNVPLTSTNFAAVTCGMQSGTVTDGVSPLASPDVRASLSGMGLNSVDLCLLQDAMREECAVLGVGPNTPAGHVTSVSGRGVETSSAESDSSLSDWSIIELPSPPTKSSVGVDTACCQANVASLTSPSLMQFSSDSGCSDSSNLVRAGPVPGRVDKFRIPRPGLNACPVDDPSVESRRKADDLMMVCAMKETAGDLHAALLCCNQATLSYKQCVKAMESSTYVSLTELHAVKQKCTEALNCSRRIHSLIQSKYDKARSDNSKQLTNVSLASSTSCSTQTPGLTSPISTRPAMSNNENLIQLEESMPSVRQQMFKEQLPELYRRPFRANAFRGGQVRQSHVNGIVALQQEQGSGAGAS